MNNNFRDTRLLEAFEYIDPKYINEVGKDLKLRSVYSTEEEHTKTTFRTHIKQLATLAACVLLLSLAIPVLDYVRDAISSLASGWGTSTDAPEQTSDLMIETTDALNEATVETRPDTLETTDAITGEDSTEVTPKLDYLKYIPELEEISDETMLEIKKAWSQFRYKTVYDSNYPSYVSGGYSDEEACELASKDAKRDSENAYEQFFNGLYFYYFGYLGSINDSVVLASYSGVGQPIDGLTIGGVDFGFKARFYVYTDGKIISLEEAYDEKIISGDELLIIKNRNEQYIESKYDYYAKQFQ